MQGILPSLRVGESKGTLGGGVKRLLSFVKERTRLERKLVSCTHNPVILRGPSVAKALGQNTSDGEERRPG